MQKQRAKASHVCVISELLPKYFYEHFVICIQI